MEREFIDILGDLDDGKVEANMTKGLRDVVMAVMETGKTGTLTLTLKVTKEKRMAFVAADVKAKLPQPATESTPFWTTAEGELCREDPMQLPLKNLSVKPPAPPKSLKDQAPAFPNEKTEE